MTSEERDPGERELRERDERHRAFLATSTEAIWRFELDSPLDTSLDVERQVDAIIDRAWLAECNDAMARMYGFDHAGELIGTRLDALLVRDDPANRDYLRAFIRSGYRLNGHESHEVDRHGRLRHFRNSLVGIVEGGSIVRAWGTQTDVTELKAAQDRQAFLARIGQVLVSTLDHRETLGRVAELSVPAIADACAVDLLADDGSLLRVAVADRDPERSPLSREAAHRWPPDRSARRDLAEVITNRRPLVISEVTEAVLSAIAREPDHLAFMRSIGLRSLLLAPMIARDRVLGVVTLAHVSSDRRFTEADVPLVQEFASRAATAIENARLYEEAQVANRAKDDFLARLSHELRTPLNATLGWTQILRTSSPDASQLERGLAVIDRNARALARIIEDLLDFSRNVRGLLRIEPSTIDLRTVVREAVASVDPLAEQKGVQLVFADGEPIALEGDADRLQQVVWNLLTNAIKFTPAGGRVTIAPRNAGESVELEVRDTGEGIPPALLGTIFDPFRQASVGSTGGLGLGLAIVRQIVDAHGGTISAVSDGGGGAAFTVRLPRRQGSG